LIQYGTSKKSMSGKLENTVAVITGGARGIGKDIALTFASEGADLVIVDIIPENLKKVRTELIKK